MLNDLRFAFRLLLKNPTFTAVAVVAIALGIGASTAVLSLVNALLIRPLPYRDPARIVLMLEHFRAQHLDAIPVSAPEFVDYQTTCRSFEKMAVFQPATFNFAGGDRPERIFGAVGSADLFIGKRISIGASGAKEKWATIIGIVADVRHRGLDYDPLPEYYMPITQTPNNQAVLVVRSSQDAASLISAIRTALREIDPAQPIAHVRTLEQVVADSVAPRRLSIWLLGLFAAIALALASIGIYGVMSFLVVQRTHELGVRMALGAQRRDILRLVVGHAAKLILTGTFIGLALAFATTRLLAAMLYRVSPHDLSTFAFVTVVLGAIALVATYIPTSRVIRTDPMLALTHTA